MNLYEKFSGGFEDDSKLVGSMSLTIINESTGEEIELEISYDKGDVELSVKGEKFKRKFSIEFCKLLLFSWYKVMGFDLFPWHLDTKTIQKTCCK